MPRYNEYELFSNNGKTYSFDDGNISITTPDGMFDWIRSQDPSLWRGLDNYPNINAAFYLKPELYLIWKLRWYSN